MSVTQYNLKSVSIFDKPPWQPCRPPPTSVFANLNIAILHVLSFVILVRLPTYFTLSLLKYLELLLELLMWRVTWLVIMLWRNVTQTQTCHTATVWDMCNPVSQKNKPIHKYKQTFYHRFPMNLWILLTVNIVRMSINDCINCVSNCCDCLEAGGVAPSKENN